jgi:hypothetical protein
MANATPTHSKLTTPDLDRLIKLLGMLGSGFDGERAAAGRLIHEFVTTRKLSWHDLLVSMPPLPPPIVVVKPSRTWVEVVEEILERHAGALRPAERNDFLPSLLDKGRYPSIKQEAWLLDIVQRCGVELWDPIGP